MVFTTSLGKLFAVLITAVICYCPTRVGSPISQRYNKRGLRTGRMLLFIISAGGSNPPSQKSRGREAGLVLAALTHARDAPTRVDSSRRARLRPSRMTDHFQPTRRRLEQAAAERPRRFLPFPPQPCHPPAHLSLVSAVCLMSSL